MAVSPALAAWFGVSEAEAPDDDEDRRWRERRRDPRLKPAMRTCLGPVCWGRERFLSEHAGQRICPRCRALLRDLYGISPASDDAA